MPTPPIFSPLEKLVRIRWTARCWHRRHARTIAQKKRNRSAEQQTLLNAQRRLTYSRNPEQYRSVFSRWRKRNPDKFKATQKRYASKPEVHVTKTLRCRISNALRGNEKSNQTLSLIGCSAATLKFHLEQLFQPGMSWDNYGVKGWHVDHIKPCASFDLSKPENQSVCFHYTNLQPLWWRENIKKGARL